MEEQARGGERRTIRLEALASGFVACLALLVSAYTVYIQRQQLKVQVWPRLAPFSEGQVGSNTSEVHISFGLKNRGVAPAEVRSVQVTFDGEAMPDWKAWFERAKRKQGVQGPLAL